MNKFILKPFSEINVNDPFFLSLKEDYPGNTNSTGFIEWFNKKSLEGAKAYVLNENNNIMAFLALKQENEKLYVDNNVIEAKNRIKVSTLKIANVIKGQRYGEGAIGLILKEWSNSSFDEIYLTIFEKHKVLVDLLEKFGFKMIGHNSNKERVYLKSKNNIDFNDYYKCFPYINSNSKRATYILTDSNYHDILFPYSELNNTKQEALNISAANGITKVYVGSEYNPIYRRGDISFIYRKSNIGPKKYKSCLTSYCIVNDIFQPKIDNNYYMSFEELIKRIGNKSIFDQDYIYNGYIKNRNVTIITLIYYGYFGKGNNINLDWLQTNNLWTKQENAIYDYPTKIVLNKDQLFKIFEKGGVDVQNIIIN